MSGPAASPGSIGGLTDAQVAAGLRSGAACGPETTHPRYPAGPPAAPRTQTHLTPARPPRPGSARPRVSRQPFFRPTRGGGPGISPAAIATSARLFAEGTAATLWAAVRPGNFPARQAAGP